MFTDLRCSPSCSRAGVHGTVSICPPDCFQYKGTFDVFTKIIRQVCLPCSVKKTRTFFFFFFFWLELVLFLSLFTNARTDTGGHGTPVERD